MAETRSPRESCAGYWTSQLGTLTCDRCGRVIPAGERFVRFRVINKHVCFRCVAIPTREVVA